MRRKAAGASDAEGFPATATITFVGVVELEAFIEAFTDEVELRAIDVGQALGINQDLDAQALENDVFGRDLVGELDLVGQARATRGLDTQAHTDALAATAEVASDVACSRFGQANSHVGVDLPDFGQRAVTGPTGART